eukprot:5919667-Pleurochrysis_carterae.AAC.6
MPACPCSWLFACMRRQVELVVVVGKEGRRIPREHAASHIAGYTVAHDVSARDLQFKSNGGQWLLGKTMDGYAPIGPAIVTGDELDDAASLGVRCFVNGELMQSSNTKELVHGPADVVAYASKYMTLKARARPAASVVVKRRHLRMLQLMCAQFAQACCFHPGKPRRILQLLLHAQQRRS